MMLATGVCIGILVLIGIPAVIGLWRFIKELIQQTKDAQAYLYEIMDEKRAVKVMCITIGTNAANLLWNWLMDCCQN